MPSLEYVVRPFQSPGSQGALIIPSTPQPTNERATLTWGAKAAVPAVRTGVGFAGCCKEENDETGRDTDTLVIHDSAEPENYITVSRATRLQWDRATKDECAGDWDQFSGIGLEVSAALNQFSADIHSGTAAPTGDSGTCKATLNLSANTVPTA